MRHVNTREKINICFYVLAVVVVVLDQATKIAARNMLADGRVIKVIPGFFDLRLDFNDGGAFGILPNMALLFILIGLVAVFAIVKIKKYGAGSRVLTTGLSLILGGALGNIIDRIVSPSRRVTDFLSLHSKTYAWPTFNVADIAIVVGVILILFHVYILERWRTESTESGGN